MWGKDKEYEVRKQHYESIRREVEAHRLARKLGHSDWDTLRSIAARLRGWLLAWRHKLPHPLVEKDTSMDDFDAKNRLRDLHREADNERIARLVEAGTEAKKPKETHWSFFNVTYKFLARMFTQTRRAGG